MTEIIVEDNDLQPIDWQKGDIAISKIHFYMIYNDPNKGITVLWSNKITNKCNRRYSFKSRNDAKRWIKNVHYEITQEHA